MTIVVYKHGRGKFMLNHREIMRSNNYWFYLILFILLFNYIIRFYSENLYLTLIGLVEGGWVPGDRFHGAPF
jgi:hypothetical protein